MSVSTDSLLAVNGGDIDPALFPSDGPASLDTKLAAWIAEGATKAAALTDADVQDPAVTHWAYSRAFRAVFIRLSSQPSTVALPDQIDTSMLVTQIQNFKDLADEHLRAFEAAVPASGVGEPLPLRTSSTSVSYGW